MWPTWDDLAGPLGVALRLGPVCALAPFLGARRTPAPIRVGLCAALALAWGPQGPAPPFRRLLFDALSGAWAAGISLVVFKSAEAAGRLLDVARGTHHAEVLSAHAADRSSPLGRLAEILSLALFAELHGPARTLAGLRRLALGAEDLLDAWATAFEAAFTLVVPAMSACLVTDLAFGLMARWATRLQAFILALGPKSLVGVAVFALGLLGAWDRYVDLVSTLAAPP
jgi:flagellar biosynthesis protein FliR